jgi:muramoyltetrapeptide carboxypeptidase
MPKYIKAAKLKTGDKVGLVSPSESIQHLRALYEPAKRSLEDGLGIKIVPGQHLFGEDYYSAGTPEERASDLNAMFANPEIKAIFFRAAAARRLIWLTGWIMN